MWSHRTAVFFHMVVAAGETVDCETLVARFAADEEELAALQAGEGEGAPAAGAEPTAQEAGQEKKKVQGTAARANRSGDCASRTPCW